MEDILNGEKVDEVKAGRSEKNEDEMKAGKTRNVKRSKIAITNIIK